jgi:hypothetical protein
VTEASDQVAVESGFQVPRLIRWLSGFAFVSMANQVRQENADGAKLRYVLGE